MAGEAFDPRPRGGVSYVVGDTSVPLAHATVPALLEDTVRRCPDAPAVVFREQGVRCTWRAFAEQVDALAAGLHALGLQRGERIGIWSPNRYEWVLTQFATARLGLILVNINLAYRLAELEYALNKVGCKAIVAAEAFKTSRYLEMLQTLAPELTTAQPGALQAAKLPALRWVIRMGEGATPGTINFGEVMARGQGAYRPARSTPSPPRCHRTTRSTSSSPAAPPARPRAPRSPTSTSSTTRASLPWR